MEEGANSVSFEQESNAEWTAAGSMQSNENPVTSMEAASQAVDVVPADHGEEAYLSSGGELVILNLNPKLKAVGSRHIASKWLKTSVLLQDSRVARHIPDTRIYTKHDLSSMLSAYRKVVLKPVIGTGGSGLIMITKADGHYVARYRQSIRRFGKFDALVAFLNRIRHKRKYLIQRGISLATINGRPIDYRVKVVRERKGWITTAMVGRLARPGLFVTNLCKGGTMLTSAQGIRLSLSASAVPGKKREMRNLTRLCVSLLERSFPGVGQFGFDYGIDHSGMIWIFEVNTKPH
ncbi:MAG: hypothetical protein K0R67_2489 [Paenibacillus sp.]|jgi:hypothetical protein|nr:hypothetical protein [Paenibacillus sp.]